MDTLSRHLLVEYRGCNVEALDDPEHIEALLSRAASAARVTIVQTVFHRFSPQGVSGVVLVEESH
ncbi:MAG: S-adenosylmethionine decarboxylase, partial [Myxococcota bacterium]